jgi:hypothetical protein
MPHPSSSAHQANNANDSPTPATPGFRGTTLHPDSTDLNRYPSLVDNHVPFGIGKNLDNRTGRLSTSGYQIPFITQRNFSGLTKSAPVSYDTLQRNGMLNLDGTPTRKYSPGSREDNRMSPVYDSPTRTWGNKKSLVMAQMRFSARRKA